MGIFDVAICDIKNWTRWAAETSVRVHRAWRHHGGQCSQQSTGRPNEYDVRGHRWIDCIARLGNGRASGRARVNVFVVRAFLRMRSLLGDKRELARQLAALEKELKQRLDVHEAAIVTILQRVMVARVASSQKSSSKQMFDESLRPPQKPARLKAARPRHFISV